MTSSESLRAEVAAAVSRIAAEFEAYCANENADPDAYLEQLADTLEGLEAGGSSDAVSIEAIRHFLDERAARGEAQGMTTETPD